MHNKETKIKNTNLDEKLNSISGKIKRVKSIYILLNLF